VLDLNVKLSLKPNMIMTHLTITARTKQQQGTHAVSSKPREQFYDKTMQHEKAESTL